MCADKTAMSIIRYLATCHSPDFSIEVYHDSADPAHIQYSCCSCADLVIHGSYLIQHNETIEESMNALVSQARTELLAAGQLQFEEYAERFPSACYLH